MSSVGPFKIPFNKPFIAGNELSFIREAVESGHLSGNGNFTRRCQAWFEERYGLPKCLLTTSCTDALEMSAILAEIAPGDEVIVPSYTFVSSANAFVLRGAKIVFADSESKTPNLDTEGLADLITERTRAIVVVHYAGVACDMDPVLALAAKHSLTVIEDAAQAIESRYKGRPLGSLGHLATFSFHETKNVLAGEGGLLVVNKPDLTRRAEVIWEKGTDRAAFFRGEVDKYGWVDVGSSFLPAELVAAFLYGQLEEVDRIQAARLRLWDRYHQGLRPLEERGVLSLPHLPSYATNNGHMFYLLANTEAERDALLAHLRGRGIMAVFHYLPLHASRYYRDKHDGRPLPRADSYAARLIRLPMFFELRDEEQDEVVTAVTEFFQG